MARNGCGYLMLALMVGYLVASVLLLEVAGVGLVILVLDTPFVGDRGITGIVALLFEGLLALSPIIALVGTMHALRAAIAPSGRAMTTAVVPALVIMAAIGTFWHAPALFNGGHI